MSASAHPTPPPASPASPSPASTPPASTGAAARTGWVHRVFVTPLLPRPRLRRFAQLYAGLYLFGLGAALQVGSHLGASPWDVLHQGLTRQFGLTIGTWSILVGALLMLLWIPLRQKPGLGTISNVVLVGLSLDFSLWWLPEVDHIVWRSLYLLAGMLVLAVGTGCYIGAKLGPGPRDGLMTGLAAKGLSVRLARTGIEVTVVIVGFLLGGTVGVGTLLFALAIGPLTQPFMPLMEIRDPAAPAPRSGL